MFGLIGIAGAFIARFLGQSLFGWYRDGDAPGWIMSILGAVLLLWLYKLVPRKGSARRSACGKPRRVTRPA